MILYWHLNLISSTFKAAYSNVQDMEGLSILGKAHIHSTLDAKSGYTKIINEEQENDKSTFLSPYQL